MTRLLILILLLGVLFIVYCYHDKFMNNSNTNSNSNTNTNDMHNMHNAQNNMNAPNKVTKLKFSSDKNKENRTIIKLNPKSKSRKIEFIDDDTDSDKLTFGSYDEKSHDSLNEYEHDKKRKRVTINTKKNDIIDDDDNNDNNDDDDDDSDEKSNLTNITGYSNFTLSEL